MDDKGIRKTIDDTYEDSREESLRSMVGGFYSRRMFSTAVSLALDRYTGIYLRRDDICTLHQSSGRTPIGGLWRLPVVP